MKAGRENSGIPDWYIVEDWIEDDDTPPYPEEEEVKEVILNNPEIRKLENYYDVPEENFWENFPHRELPKSAETKVNLENLRKRVKENENKMRKTELKRAERTVEDLEKGAKAYQKNVLPPMKSQNSKSAYIWGHVLTDTIVTWIKKGFVAGPFDVPPVEGFRANPLAAIVKNGKVRPVLNMSGPIGKSFNDNIAKEKMEKVHMATAKQFSYAVKEAGKNAIFSKSDIKDAYKLVPAKTEDYRLQGFCWLGKYFVETQETFGGKNSVSNFDRLAKTKDLLVCLESGTRRDRVFRVLDDSPCVAPEKSGITEKFTKEMRKTCEFVNIPLAENCKKNEKAFENQQRGVVLGIGFDSRNMSWFLPKEKADKVIRRCIDAKNSEYLDLKQIQKLMGSINDLAQMCPFLKFHKSRGNSMLKKFKGNENILMRIEDDMKCDLRIIAKIAESARDGLPIARRPCKPPLSTLTFYTDAAGGSFSMVKGERIFHEAKERGIACVGGESPESIWVWSRFSWPGNLITGLKDEEGKAFGCKSTTLESIGLLIPFVAFPELVKGRHLKFMIDNAAVMYGWTKGRVKEDSTATEILKCAAYMAAYTGATIHVEHVGRVSNDMAELADELSRKEKTENWKMEEFVTEDKFREDSGYLKTWLGNPLADKHIYKTLLKELKGKLT